MESKDTKKFYLSVPQIDTTISEIRKKIRILMNGTTVELMMKNGVNYTKNYGVSILGLRDIASNYSPNVDLAMRLWHLDIRETKILATMLMPKSSFSLSTLHEWLDETNQIELIEQLAMNLLSKKENAVEIVFELIKTNDKWKIITGFVLAARVWGQFDKTMVEQFIKYGLKKANPNDYLSYKTLATAAGRLSRNSKLIAEVIMQTVNESIITDELVKRYILTEVSQELIFLNS